MNAATVLYSPRWLTTLFDCTPVCSEITRAQVVRTKMDEKGRCSLITSTIRGTCEVEVSKEVHNQTLPGDVIVLRYKVGHYTGRLYGERL